MGKFLDLAKRLLSYLEARSDDTYISGLFGGLNNIVDYRA